MKSKLLKIKKVMIVSIGKVKISKQKLLWGHCEQQLVFYID